MNAIGFGQDLQKFSEYRPTQFDPQGLGSDGQEDWRVLPVTQTRDSEALAESNFETAQKLLNDANVEYEVHRFGHWGPGWFEIIVVKPTDEGLTVAGEITCALESYPVLDDEDYSNREVEEQQESWENWAREEVKDKIVSLFELSEEADELLHNHGGDALYSLWYDDVVTFYGTDLCTIGLERMTRDNVAKLLKSARKERDGERAAIQERKEKEASQ